jgi:hypothetical protein
VLVELDHDPIGAHRRRIVSADMAERADERPMRVGVTEMYG